MATDREALKKQLGNLQRRMQVHARAGQVLSAVRDLGSPGTVKQIAGRAGLGERITKHCLDQLMERRQTSRAATGRWQLASGEPLPPPRSNDLLSFTPESFTLLRELARLSNNLAGTRIKLEKMSADNKSVVFLKENALVATAPDGTIAITDLGLIELEAQVPEFRDLPGKPATVQDVPEPLLRNLRQLLIEETNFQTPGCARRAGMGERDVEFWLRRLVVSGYLAREADDVEATWSFTDLGVQELSWREEKKGPEYPPRMNKGARYQVFISSTYEDLKEERNAIIFEVLAARHIPAGMESFPASDDRGWKTITRTIHESDYYVVILGGLYGSLDAETGLSWTEREYDYARTKGLKILAFIRVQKFVDGDMVEDDPEKKAKLDAFRAKLREAHLVKEWTTADDLRARVVQALNAHIHDDMEEGARRPGWYRGNQIPDVQELLAKLDDGKARTSELEELLEHKDKEITGLRARIKELESDLEPAPVKPTKVKPGGSQFAIGTAEVTFELEGPITGWQVNNLGARTLTVNGVRVDPDKDKTLPDPVEGNRYYFTFSAGTPAYTAINYW